MDRGDVNRVRNELQQLADAEAAKARPAREQHQAILSTAASLQVIVRLLTDLTQEVKGLRQDIAALNASRHEPEDTP